MKTAVLGNIFIDYKGWVQSAYDPAGRNQGNIEIVPGGVAHNVAENLACLGIPTYFLTTLNQDSISEMISKRLLTNHVSLDYVGKFERDAIGMWLALLDKNGNLLGSVSHLPNLKLLEQQVKNKLYELTHSINNIAMDIDLNADIANLIAESVRSSKLNLYALPGNLSVISQNYDLFKYMQCFVCNDIEAAKLLNTSFQPDDLASAQQLVKKFKTEFGVPQAVITLGEHGSVYVDIDGNTGFQPIYPAQMIDCTGAGDAFFSAVTAYLIRGKSLSEATAAGAKLASMIISNQENTCGQLPVHDLKA